MNNKKSAALRNLITSSLKGAEMDPASVIITGAGIASPADVITDAQTTETAAFETPGEPEHGIVVGESGTSRANDGQISRIKNLGLADNPINFAQEESHRAPISYVPKKLPKAPTWQKANVTLEPEDMAILEHSDTCARSYGFRIRKGGNPSLFVRAGLRLLNDLLEKDPDTWVKRIAETIPSSET